MLDTEIGRVADPYKRFFAFCRARHQIHLDRVAGRPWPWTDDPVLQQYRFTNVFRELDRTTKWFRSNVRESLRDRPEVLLATAVFRMLNRVEVGEAVFCQKALGMGGERRGETAFDYFARTHEEGSMRASILQYCGEGPYVTGAYMITSPRGMSKLDGVLRVLRDFAMGQWPMPDGGYTSWRGQAIQLLEFREQQPYSLEDLWNVLRQVPWFGPFHSYEMVTDLRHTALLDMAPDIMIWANPGPGCQRGLSRVLGQPTERSTRMDRDDCLALMTKLLRKTQQKKYWPQEWRGWEMRDVEHTLCEFDKYERTRLGEGRPRGVYRP